MDKPQTVRGCPVWLVTLLATMLVGIVGSCLSWGIGVSAKLAAQEEANRKTEAALTTLNQSMNTLVACLVGKGSKEP
jgi:membrane protein YqaA with SNARE-associated domain